MCQKSQNHLYSLRQFLQPQLDQLRGFRTLAGDARGAGDGSGGLRRTVAEIDQRRDRVGNRTRRAIVIDRAGQMHQRRIDIGEGRRLVLQFGDDAFGHLRADAGRACHRRLVADALHGLQQAKPFTLGVAAKAKQFYLILAHVSLDRKHRGFTGRGQRLQRPRRTVHLIADTADVEDHIILAVRVDQSFEFADHIPTTFSRSMALARWCACVMAMASASAASGDFGSALGSRIFNIIRTWFLSACPAPTTVFFTWFGAYSATEIPNIAGASIATPRAWPSFSVATPSLLTKVCSTAASAGRKSPSTAARPPWIASRRLASGRPSGGSTEPQPTNISRLPSISITPQPVRRRPGSMPRMRTGWRIG